MDCIWPHHIKRLYGVPVTPVECLPRRCACGEPLTYADPVLFISMPRSRSIEGVVTVEELDVKFEPAVPEKDKP